MKVHIRFLPNHNPNLKDCFLVSSPEVVVVVVVVVVCVYVYLCVCVCACVGFSVYLSAFMFTMHKRRKPGFDVTTEMHSASKKLVILKVGPKSQDHAPLRRRDAPCSSRCPDLLTTTGAVMPSPPRQRSRGAQSG